MLDRRLLKLLEKSKKYIYQTVFLNWIAMLANISTMILLTMILTHLRENQSWTLSTTICSVGIFFVIAIRVIMQRKAAQSAYKTSGDVKQTIRKKLYQKIMCLGISYQEDVSTAQIIQVATEGVEQLEIYFGKYLPQLLYSVVAPLTLFVIVAFVNFKIAIILLVCVPLIPVSIVLVQRIAKRLLTKYWGSYTDMGNGFLENLQGLTTLKIYQADERKAQEMDARAEDFRKATMRVLLMQLNSIGVMDIVAFGGAALGIGMALLEYHQQNISFAGMVLIVLLSSEFFIPVRMLGSFFHIAMNGAAASDKIFMILELEEPKAGNEKLEQIVGINLQNMSFSYQADRWGLKEIDLMVEKGALVAIVGPSGCGKSTIAKLLTGQNKGYQGNILIGGKELSQIPERELLTTITALNHNSYIFSGTVKDNLQMSKNDILDEEMLDILKTVGLVSLFEEKGGLDAHLTEQGNNLSGGQRQRLALARVLLHNSPIYIFDEATSNIDVESEEKLMEVIQAMKGNKTLFVISHRLKNVEDADVICYMEDGYIREQGTHTQLMSLDKGYKKMYCQQQELEHFREGGAYA